MSVAFPGPGERAAADADAGSETAFREKCLDHVRRLALSPGQRRWVSLPAPAAVAPEAMLALAPEASFWAGRDEHLIVGLGESQVLSASGSGRFGALQAQAETLLGSVEPVALLGALPRAPKVLGGCSFRPGGAEEPPWADFGDARFVLPQVSFEQTPAGCTLSVLLSGDSPVEQQLQPALSLRARLPQLTLPRSGPAQLLAPSPAGSVGRSLATGHDLAEPASKEQAQWASAVVDILTRIRSGACSKVVAALRQELHFAAPLDVAATVAALCAGRAGASSPATAFAFQHAGVTFCGATPERLIRRVDQCLQTEALAGTFQRGDASFAQELLRSPKEHEEHAPVLQAIVEALSPVCRQLSYPDHPQICELPHLLHLHTPVTATLRAPMHVLNLVERLHPTPAVGGVPRELAQDWIAHHEPHERGWYAGPVGWFDARGDGDFFVALRSGLLQGQRAFLFAGAGIVAASEPHTEYAETQLKLRGLRAALRS